MMGIYIEGMKMPKPKLTDMATIYDAYILVSPNGHATIIVNNEDELNSTEYLLVSVPPHGRCVDTRYIESENDRFFDMSRTSEEFDEHASAYAYSLIANILANAPTIIPSDPQKEE